MLSATIQGQVPVGAAWGVALDWLANISAPKAGHAGRDRVARPWSLRHLWSLVTGGPLSGPPVAWYAVDGQVGIAASDQVGNRLFPRAH